LRVSGDLQVWAKFLSAKEGFVIVGEAEATDAILFLYKGTMRLGI
jgi:hypothetical protein